MINLILAAVVAYKALRQKCYGCIPAAILIVLYELVGMYPLSRMEHSGTIQRLLILLVAAAVWAAWRAGHAGKTAICCSAAACVVRWAWFFVFGWYENAMLQPQADPFALMQQQNTMFYVFDTIVLLLIAVLQLSMLLKMRRPKPTVFEN